MLAIGTWQHPSSPVRPTFLRDSSSQQPKRPSLLQRCQITLHRAANVPVSDPNDLSSDPYFLLTLLADPVGLWESKDQSVTFRTHTVRGTLNPTFDSRWVVSGIPHDGFALRIELKEEDPLSTDDRLGQATLHFPSPYDPDDPDGSDDSHDSYHHHPRHDGSWECHEREFRIHKRRGSIKSKVSTFVAKLGTKDKVDRRVRVWISVRNLGLAEDQEDKRLFTIGPHRWFQHFSPNLGVITGTSPPSEPESVAPSPSVASSPVVPESNSKSFVANRLQLSGPLPLSLHHHYVPFAPFVKLMFTSKGVEGAFLNKALKKQYREVYKWDEKVKWGITNTDVGDWEVDVDKRGRHAHRRSHSDHRHLRLARPQLALAHQFLEMISYGQGGRIFTYVLMLDGELRFTETGDHLAIQYLSKHTMHSDVASEIAYSGEFFVRPYRPRNDSDSSGQRLPIQDQNKGCEPSPPSPASDIRPQLFTSTSKNPHDYELILDNDSGTYRPQSSLLQTLYEFLSSEGNFGRESFGRIRVMEAFDETLLKWKKEWAKVSVF